MDTALLQDLTALFRVLNTPFGVAVLAIIALGILPKIPRLRDYFGINQSANANGAVDDLKPVLSELTAGIAKISGNDLSHIQKSIDNIGAKIDHRFDNFDDKLAAHDKQAGEIKMAVENIWSTCRTHKQ